MSLFPPFAAQFWIAGEPVPQPRPRAMAQQRYSPKKRRKVWVGHVYEAESDHAIFPWKALVERVARRHAPPQPLEGPVELVLDIFLPRPLEHYIARDRACGVRPGAPEWVTARGSGDGDNFQKAVQDVLERKEVSGVLLGAGFFLNDSQVCRWGGTKRYRHRPGVLVTVRTIEE